MVAEEAVEVGVEEVGKIEDNHCKYHKNNLQGQARVFILIDIGA